MLKVFLNKIEFLTKNRIFKYSIGYIVVDGIQKLSYFLAIPLFTKLMPPAQYGAVMICLSVVAIQQVIFSLSTRGAIARFYVKENSENRLSLLLSTTLFLTVIMAAFWSFFNFIAFNGQKEVFQLMGVSHTRLIKWALVVALTNSFVQIFFTIQKTGRRFLSYGFFTIAYIVTQIYAIYLGINNSVDGAEGYLKGLAISNSIWALIFTLLIFLENGIQVKLETTKLVLGYSATVFPVDLISLATSYTDRYITSAYLGGVEVAMYSLANQLIAMVGMACLAFNNAYVPHFFHAYDNEKKEMSEIYQAAKIFVLIITGIGLIGLLIGSAYVNMCLPKEYHSTLLLLPIYFTTISLNSVYLIGTNALALTKDLLAKKITVLLIALIFNFFLSIFLIEKFGFSGPAYSGLITQIIICVAYSEIVYRFTSLKFPFYRFIGFILGIGMFGAILQKTFF